jgi:cytochrome b561
VAALIIVGWTLAQLRGFMPQDRAPIMDLHRSVGVTVFALVLVRLVWRLFNRPPALPEGTAKIVRWLAHAGHAALYALMLGVPVCGMVMTWAGGHEIAVWGLFTVPAPMSPAPQLRETLENLHGLLGNTLIWLVGFHAAAALVHHYVFKDGLLDRILPGRSQRRERSPGALT